MTKKKREWTIQDIRTGAMYVGLAMSGLGVLFVILDTVLFDNRLYWQSLIPVHWIGWAGIVVGQLVFWGALASGLLIWFSRFLPERFWDTRVNDLDHAFA